uniref:Uncharacterized protein n=1 Tax=Ditylenchus dipsaci TaxID=166011 RepID=A0A915E3T4_9BILA
MYEMLTGKDPFATKDFKHGQREVKRNKKKYFELHFPEDPAISQDAQDLIKCLLEIEKYGQKRRCGIANTPDDSYMQIMEMNWFKEEKKLLDHHHEANMRKIIH